MHSKDNGMKKQLPWLKTDGKRIVTDRGDAVLLQGVGLGGWMLPEGYMWKLEKPYDRPRRIEELVETVCGASYATSFWERYLESYITEDDIAYIARMGFNSVRLPLNSRTLCTFNEANDPVFSERVIRKVDELLLWCEKYHVYCILDLHGAPGGQTGENIDDSEHDIPSLFIEDHYREQCIALWRALASRYHDRSVIAGYDLLNEPLPQWHGAYNDRLMPLYRDITKAIREVDKRHIIILEGLHWATDWSPFEALKGVPIDTNYLLEFHKYWSNPDWESISSYAEMGERLQVPIFMGEGGENNLEWYTAAFSLYTSHEISWNFWTYKKMACTNSPVSFPAPKGWENQEKTRKQFDELLHNILEGACFLDEVSHAILRTPPLTIPAQWYDAYRSRYERIPGAAVRSGDPISILFCDGHRGEVNYRKLAGEPQNSEDALYVHLRPAEELFYHFIVREQGSYTIQVEGEGDGECEYTLTVDKRLPRGVSQENAFSVELPEGSHCVGIALIKGALDLKSITIKGSGV